MAFHFVGQISASKSLVNRALILKSHCEELGFSKSEPLSQADDVVLMQAALKKLKAHGKSREVLTLDCGHAGTVLRFLAFRVAREKGRFILKGSERLFSRPLDDLKKVLMQLGSVVKTGPDFLEIECDGWRLMGDQLYIPSDKSSQFASGFLLNAWDLPFEIFFRTSAKKVSEPYFKMTWELARKLGMNVDVVGEGEFHIPARQKLRPQQVHLEPDMSSAFALAACAAVNGEMRLTDWPSRSLQPDYRFVEILKQMKVPVREEADRLEVSKASELKPIKLDLTGAPDLFPVLVSLCALAQGESEFTGISHLAYKESSRAENMRDLLKKLSVETRLEADRFTVFGRGELPKVEAFSFDPDEDHRIYMAARILKLAGAPIDILHPEVVNKSFPEFLGILEGAS